MSKPKPIPKSSSAKATPAKKAATTKTPTTKTAAKKAPSTKSAASKKADAEAAAEQAFIEAAIARGEAQPASKDGSLPEGATHELVESPDGKQTVRRRRFSAA